MNKKEEESKKSIPIERYKHFKGIYVERTKEYYLCDFYEMTREDNSIFYRIKVDLNNRQLQIAEMICGDAGQWKFADPQPTFAPELENLLSQAINEVCLKKQQR